MPLAKKLFALAQFRQNKAPAVDDNQTHAKQLLATLFQMAWFVEARDPYTGGHLWRVSRYAQLLANEAGLDQTLVAQASLGGFLHDLGKVGIPDAILRKADKLTDEEYTLIKTHPAVGLRLLTSHPLSALVQDAVYLHHERPDGRGYPQGLQSPEIPLVARIVGICDAFDAMTSCRPYRKSMCIESALEQLHDMADRQFDANLVAHMDELWRQGLLHHVQGHSDEGIRLQDCLMCGPTLVVRRNNKAGEHLYCRNCSGEYHLAPGEDGDLTVTATGAQGSAKQLMPETDAPLIASLINEAMLALSASGLLSVYQPIDARQQDAIVN